MLIRNGSTRRRVLGWRWARVGCALGARLEFREEAGAVALTEPLRPQ
jgi:hypothetical protein